MKYSASKIISNMQVFGSNILRRSALKNISEKFEPNIFDTTGN